MFFTKNVVYKCKVKRLYLNFSIFYHTIFLILGCTKMHGDLDTTYTFNKCITNMDKAIWQLLCMISYNNYLQIGIIITICR